MDRAGYIVHESETKRKRYETWTKGRMHICFWTLRQGDPSTRAFRFAEPRANACNSRSRGTAAGTTTPDAFGAAWRRDQPPVGGRKSDAGTDSRVGGLRHAAFVVVLDGFETWNRLCAGFGGGALPENFSRVGWKAASDRGQV